MKVYTVKPEVVNITIRNVTFLVLAIVIFNEAAAQRAVYNTNSGMTLGFGLGAAYQQSDIANSRGAGFDFFLGSHIYKKQNALLSIDWKFRILAGENKAYDHRINTDSTYSNISYGFYNYDLELGLALNRLRERTRIVLSGFAGIGITNGIISTDLLDDSENPYDYSAIDPGIGKKQIYESLLNLSDKEFEKKLFNKAAIMPTCGLYLGYQFSHSFSLGIEHKINFSLTENNSLTGIDIDNKIVTDSRIDMNHYTSLGFKWILGGRASRSARRNTGTVVNNPVTPNNQNTDKPIPHPNPVISVPPPAVEITSPSGNSFSAVTGSLDITARVKNVKGKQDIRVVLNEKNIAFEYNLSNGNVSSRLTLTEGKNILAITGSNETGSARDELIINWNKPVRGALPVVKFIDPASPVTVRKNIISITVQTRNVKAWQDVTVTVNGTNTNNFNFSPDGLVTTNIPLNDGVNKVNVTAKNESGIASDVTTIAYTKPVISVPPPAVEIISPPGSTYTAATGSLDISARVKNVNGKQDIYVILNDKNIAFEYNPFYGNVSSKLTLTEGKNILAITGSNETGSARDELIINWNKPVQGALPVVKFIDPASPATVEKNVFPIRVQTRNVKARQDVTVMVNGIKTDNFNFSPDGIVTTNIPLKEGVNKLEITGKNESGTASDLTTIVYTKPVKAVLPVINILTPDVSPFNTYEPMQEIRAKITGVKGKENISLSLNESTISGFTFDDKSLVLNASVALKNGKNTIMVTARNDAGQVFKSLVIIREIRPCPLPVLKMIEPAQKELLTGTPSCTIRTGVSNIADKNQVSISLNDRIITNYNFSGNEIIFSVSLNAGINSCIIAATNTCGTQKITYSISYEPADVVVEKPCPKPGINFNISAISKGDLTHGLKGTASHVANRSDIFVTVNNKSYEVFTFVPNTGEIGAEFKFVPGSHTVKVVVKNDCGQDEYSRSIVVDENKPCGIRINPGNSSWEFCLVTPSGTIRRDVLTNPDFRYSGPASSLYFLPIAGGGDAVVKGKPYTIQPGQYYLFTGNLTVTVSTKNSGSMGQWSVCIVADREPLSGNGNNRPMSPCEEQGEEKKPKKDGESKNGN